MDRQPEILRAIAFTTRYLSDVRHLPERLPMVLAYLGRAAGARRVYLYENEVANGRFLCHHRLGWSAFRYYFLYNSPSLQNINYQQVGFEKWAKLLAAGQPIIVDSHTLSDKERVYLLGHNVRMVALFPIISGGQWWGFVGFDHYNAPRQWTVGEIETLNYVGQAIGVALENARLFHAEARRRREAEILNEVSGVLVQGNNLEQAIASVLKETLSYLGGHITLSISLFDRQRQALKVLAQVSTWQTYPFIEIGAYLSVAETAVSYHVLQTGRPFAIPDLTQQPFSSERAATAVAAGLRAVFYIPLLLGDQAIGVLHFDLGLEPRTFTPAEITFCQGIANLLAAALDRQRLAEMKYKQLQLAHTLQQVGALLTTQMSLDELYDQIFTLLAQVVAYDSVSIQLFNEMSDSLYLVAARGLPNVSLIRDFIHSIAHHCLDKFPGEETVTVISDTYNDEHWIRRPEVDYIRSWVGALLRVKGKNIGILNVDSRQVGAFDESAAAPVAAFANQAAIAIENARLYESARQQADELAILNEVALVTAVTVNIDDLLYQTTQTIRARLAWDSFGFVLIDEVSQTLFPHASYYGVTPARLHAPIPIAHSITGLVVESGEPVIVPNVCHEARYWVGNEAIRSEVAVPLQVDNHVIGVINAESIEPDAFCEDDVRFLTTLAALIGATIVRVRLYQQLQAQSAGLRAEVKSRTAELQSERDRTLTILESAGESIIVTDAQRRILYVNPATEWQSGYGRDELLDQTPALLESGLTPNATHDEMWQTVMQGQQWSGEMVNRRKDGTLYDVAMTIAPVRNAAGEVLNFVAIQSDITRLKELDRLKSIFVTNVSHELRTPLTNVKTYLTLLERGRDENRERYFRVLHHETDRLTQLIQDLLDLSRLETEALPESLEPLDLCQVVTEYFDIFRAKAEVRQIALRLEAPGALLPVAIEARHLGQLLTNLLGNALSYTPPHGQVWLRMGTGFSPTAVAHEAGLEQVWFSVSDTGMGIADEDMPYLFERFFRGQAVQTSGIPGTGLGLAICGEIVRRYHGRIEVESVLGRGTTFVVWLPQGARAGQKAEAT
jgi:PAS domain S-box-containing protein